MTRQYPTNKVRDTGILAHIDALILCGGLGMRLRPVVSDRPKVMAEVREKPFLEIIVRELLRQGSRRIVFCTGYLGDQIENHFKNSSYPEDVILEFSREKKPLGTGGALKNALGLVKSENFLVINGDCLSSLNFKGFYLSHLEKKSLLSIALVKRNDSDDYGSVVLAKNNEIASFIEKNQKRPIGLVSAGCYLMRKSIKEFFPAEDVFSLEYDVFPKLAGKSYGFVFDGKFLDIGTPKRYASAEDFLNKAL